MMLPRKKGYLRDILPKHGSDNSVLARREEKKDDDVVYHKIAEPVVEYEKNGGGGKWRIWVLAVVAVLVLSGALLYVFGNAEVVVTPRVDEYQFDNDFTANKGDTADIKNSLGFSVSDIEKIGSQTVAADGQKTIQSKSSGVITIYNNYSKSSQRLIRNTRFETSDGLIYRIDQSITIPPMTSAGGKLTPGKVQATVYADLPGDKYNIGPTTFTIPGFKSDPNRYAGFYGSSAAPMTGGYSGMASYLTDAKEKTVRLQIRSALEKQILVDAAAGNKDQFIPNNGYTVEFESLPISNSESNQILVQEKATMAVFSFKTANWDNFLAEQTPFSLAVGSSTVSIANRDSLDFAWLERPSSDSAQISFHLKGTAMFDWDVDKTKIADSLAGKSRGDLQNILKQYGEISSATASISPFWQTSFPSNPSKITVIVKGQK